MAKKSSSHLEEIERVLRRAIITSDFKPGERLSAESLGVLYNVSPTPVREALARLAGEGLVTHQPQRGVRVAPISLVEMDELYEIRSLLEPLAVERSVSRSDEELRVQIRVNYDAMLLAARGDVSALTSKQYEVYEERHVAFHRATLSQCGSSWLVRLTSLLSDHSQRYRHASVQLRERHVIVAAEHAEILAACLAGDAGRAREAQFTHIENTRQAVHELSEPGLASLGASTTER